MKMISKIAILAVVAAITTSGVFATCLPAKDFSSWQVDTATYYYVVWGAGSAADPLQTVGAFWEAGNRTAANEGTYSVDNWLRDYGGGLWYLNGNLGDSRVTGCPSIKEVLVVTDPSPGTRTDFFVTTADENTSLAPFFFHGPDLTFQPLPSPQVTSSSRSGTNVILDLAFSDPAAGFYSRDGGAATEAISSIVLYQAKGADPGRDVAAWTEIGRFAYAGGQTSVPAFTVDCSDTSPTFLAAGLGLDGGAYDVAHVSASIAIECDPTLADPDAKFDMIRERGKGQKRGKPFQN